MDNNVKYTIASCITKYNISDIVPLVKSIEMSGYTGDKLMLVYDVQHDVLQYLQQHGWTIIQSQPQQHIILQRFRDMHAVLMDYDTDIILFVDARDVVFQQNPIPWLETHMKKDILAFSESLQFKYEQWAITNSGTTFPMEWDWLQHEEIFCAGTIVGTREAIRDFFISIYYWSMATSNSQQLADQSAYNIHLRSYGWRDKIQLVPQQAGFVTHLHLKFKGSPSLPYTEPLAIIDGDTAVTTDGIPFVIIHQYDRNTEFKQLIERKYQ